MFDYSNPILVKIRRVFHKLGILRPAVRALRSLKNTGYEEQYDAEVFRHVHPGSVVWDVGANTGYYTKKFAAAVGPQGKVVSFEPSPETYAQLAAACSVLTNIILENFALSDFDGSAELFLSTQSTKDSFFRKGNRNDRSVSVRVIKGDSYRGTQPPGLIKIDVEGFEMEVLRGMKQTLKAGSLKCVCVEVHFSILTARNRPDAPREIVALLKDSGFSVHWTDSSHIVAQRAKNFDKMTP